MELFGKILGEREIHNNQLYAVGVFENVGGVPAQHIAKWDGEEWCGLGSEFNNNIGSLAKFKDEIIIGGGFEVIDGDSIYYNIAKWVGGNYTDTCGTYTNVTNYPKFLHDDMIIYPNPFTTSTTIRFPSSNSGNIEIVLYNTLGFRVRRVKSNSNEIILHRGNLPSGIYFYQIRTRETVLATGKLIID